MIRFRLPRGTSCKLPMDIYNSTTILDLRVTQKPKNGKLLSATRNRIVYQAGKE